MGWILSVNSKSKFCVFDTRNVEAASEELKISTKVKPVRLRKLKAKHSVAGHGRPRGWMLTAAQSV